MSAIDECRSRYLKSISLRNLYLPDGTGKEIRDNIEVTSPLDRLVQGSRRYSLTQLMPKFEVPGSYLELVELNNRKLVDSFFTIHVAFEKSREKLMYVSEVVRSNMDPTFCDVEFPCMVKHLDIKTLIVRIWCRTRLDKCWNFLSEERVNLRKLVFLGSSIDYLEDQFRSNTVLFNFKGNFYALATSLRFLVDQPHATPKLIDKPNAISYTFDTLRSLRYLTNSLMEINGTKTKLSGQISEYIDALYDTSNINNIDITTQKLLSQNNSLEKAISRQRSLNDNLYSEIINTKITINDTKEVTANKLDTIQDMVNTQSELAAAQIDPIDESLHTSIYPAIIHKLQQITTAIQEIITIENINNTVQFSIMGLQFPSSIKELLDICYYNRQKLKNANNLPVFESEAELQNFHIEQINAGLGYIIQLINILADVTNTNLKYKMVVNGNSCVVIDSVTSNVSFEGKPLTKEQGQLAMTYPLYYDSKMTEKVSVDYNIDPSTPQNRKFILQNPRLEQGLNFLNKNLVLLINNVTDIYKVLYHDNMEHHKVSNNIPVDCLDNLLWNLQYLILFMTAPIDKK